MRWKEKIYDWIAKRQAARNPQWPKMDKVKRIMVIYESDLVEKNTWIQGVKKKLQARYEEVVIWGYVPKKEVQTALLPQSRIVGTKGFNWLGYPKNDIVKDLQAKEWEIVINLAQGEEVEVRYLCLLANAKFKAGKEGMPCDLQIKTQAREDGMFLFEQIVYYLEKIESND